MARKWVNTSTGEIIPRSPAYVQRIRKGWQMVRKYGLFTLKEESVLNALSDHLNYQNQIANGEVPLTLTQMCDEIGEDRRNFAKVLKTLQSKNAVGCWSSNGVEIWYVNPALYRRGRGHKEITSSFASAAKERERLGANVFNLPHENYYSSLVKC